MQYIFNFAQIKIMIERVNITGPVADLVSLITDSKQIVLVGHVNPDGDSIGSLMGFKAFLDHNNKCATAIVPNKYPEFLEFLDEKREIIIYKEEEERAQKCITEADLILCLDFNSLKRIEALGEVVGTAGAKKALIDHHPQPDDIFDIVFSNTEVSSTCELAYYIIKAMSAGGDCKLKPLTLGGGIALYTGMMTDTNNFANSVRASTFRMACELLELGVDKEKIQFIVFGGFKEQRMRLMGYMLYENMKIFPEYKAGFMLITKEIKEKFDFSDGDSEGFVNLPLNIKGVEMAGLFTQGDDFIRVSLRSKGDFSVNRLSREFFNGGGHERAAGGKLYIPVNEVEQYFLEALKKYRHTICYNNDNSKKEELL